MCVKCACALLLAFALSGAQDEEEAYRGAYIGQLNSYHHQVSGKVYAVDEYTLLLADFNYDGLGEDTYFYVGDSSRPGPGGIILPDEHGHTNVLDRYLRVDVELTLPEGKKISSLRWFAVYDITSQQTFADVYVPEEFSAPAQVKLPPLLGSSSAGTVSSSALIVEDTVTILITEFSFSPTEEPSEVYFWTGAGPQPGPKGIHIPDDYGYLESLGKYSGSDVRLSLPGTHSLLQMSWIALYHKPTQSAIAYVSIPELLNVPPSLSHVSASSTGVDHALPHCKQLHRSLQLSWELYGEHLTLEMRGQLLDSEHRQQYMALGFTNATYSHMIGADVALLGYNHSNGRGFAHDYTITAKAPCVSVLGRWTGVCPDAMQSPPRGDDLQLLTAAEQDGVTTVRYRRGVKAREDIDIDVNIAGPAHVVWAVGDLDEEERPQFHSLYHKNDIAIDFTDAHYQSDCWPFTTWRAPTKSRWERAELSEPSVRVFSATVGPGGGERARGQGDRGRPALVWYVNGHMTPHMQLRRGLTYTVRVSGGDDPHSPDLYHPFVVRSEAAALAGTRVSRRGDVRADAAGALCLSTHAADADRRRDDDFPTFRAFNQSLRTSCSKGAPAILTLAPNTSWPDVVYYESFTHSGMGGKIFIVDRQRRGSSRRSNASHNGVSLPTVILMVLLHQWCDL